MASTTNRIRPLLYAAALYTAANAYVHAQQWWQGYRSIPTAVPGWWVVRVGFPAAAMTAAVLTVALIAVTATRWRPWTTAVLGAAAAFHTTSLAALIATRTASLFGWREPAWSMGANQARATEIGALVVLGLCAVAAQALSEQRLRPANVAVVTGVAGRVR